MALTRVSTTANNTGATPANSITGTSITPSTDDLLVCLAASTGYLDAHLGHASCSWNGNAMTQKFHNHQTGSNVHRTISGWSLIVPSGATAGAVLTLTATTSNIAIALIRYTGHNATTPIGDTDSTFQDGGTGTEPSLTLTTATGDEVLDALAFYAEFGETLTIGADQTELSQVLVNSFLRAAFSVQPADAASEVMSWTRSATRAYVYGSLVVQAAAAGGSIVPILNSQRQFAGA